MSLMYQLRCVRFNSQPPEGGWVLHQVSVSMTTSFNSQPPEGGWIYKFRYGEGFDVSTHSRPKAAGMPTVWYGRMVTSFNSQPPEGGWRRSWY